MNRKQSEKICGWEIKRQKFLTSHRMSEFSQASSTRFSRRDGNNAIIKLLKKESRSQDKFQHHIQEKGIHRIKNNFIHHSDNLLGRKSDESGNEQKIILRNRQNSENDIQCKIKRKPGRTTEIESKFRKKNQTTNDESSKMASKENLGIGNVWNKKEEAKVSIVSYPRVQQRLYKKTYFPKCLPQRWSGVSRWSQTHEKKTKKGREVTIIQ